MSKKKIQPDYSIHAVCRDCGVPYHNFPCDLVVPDDIWKMISPTGHEGGLLCPNCLCGRLTGLGMTSVQVGGDFSEIRKDDEGGGVHIPLTGIAGDATNQSVAPSSLSDYDGMKVLVKDGVAHRLCKCREITERPPGVPKRGCDACDGEWRPMGAKEDGPILRAFTAMCGKANTTDGDGYRSFVPPDGLYVCRVVECESCAGTGCVECYDPQDATDGQTLRLVREDDSSSNDLDKLAKAGKAGAKAGVKFREILGVANDNPNLTGVKITKEVAFDNTFGEIDEFKSFGVSHEIGIMSDIPCTMIGRVNFDPPIKFSAAGVLSVDAKLYNRKWYHRIWPWSKRWRFDYIAVGTDKPKEE